MKALSVTLAELAKASPTGICSSCDGNLGTSVDILLIQPLDFDATVRHQ